MHLEFRLPSGAGGQSAHYSCTVLNQTLQQWSTFYGFKYTTKITYYKLSVEFADDRAYTMFVLCWPLTQIRWQICED
jgi:hypothetical protein